MLVDEFEEDYVEILSSLPPQLGELIWRKASRSSPCYTRREVELQVL
jgi:hypothetical protein